MPSQTYQFFCSFFFLCCLLWLVLLWIFLFFLSIRYFVGFSHTNSYVCYRYNSTYPLTAPQDHGLYVSYRIAFITDQDKQSKTEDVRMLKKIYFIWLFYFFILIFILFYCRESHGKVTCWLVNYDNLKMEDMLFIWYGNQV